jgi:hypothetical protein
MTDRNILHKFSFLDWKYHGLTLGSLCAFGVIAAAVFFGLRWLQHALVSRLESLAARTATTLDDLTLALVRRTNVFYLLILALYAGTLALSLRHGTVTKLHLALLIATLWQVGLWAHELIDYAIEQLMRRHAGEDAGLQTAAGALSFVARVAVWSLT